MTKMWAWRQNGRGERHGDGFAGLGDHSAYLEAPEDISWGSLAQQCK